MADKQYGGWYWQPEQNKALRWWGADTSGKDIYTEGEEPNKRQSVTSLSSGLSGIGSDSVLGFDLGTLNTRFQDTYSKVGSLQNDLQGYQSRKYEGEYGKAGLGKIKDEISLLDSSIAGEKNTRDESVSKVRKNPGYSAATITGETGEIQRLANAKINNLIEERNTKAQSYNAGLGEITQKVATETKDKEFELNNLRYDLQFLGGLLDSYNKVRSAELASQKEAERWEKEFGLQLYNAQTSRINTTSSGGGAKTYSKESVKDAFGNVVGYFDPGTGQTNYYQTPESQQSQKTTVKEGDLRTEIRSSWKDGYQPDQLKKNLANVTTDKGKSAAAIVDEEWQLKTQPGVMGFLRRLFTPGV
ncbi:hypothetical protein A2778_05395 [Candidatus Daviesbacteria bacterium RIFCSPHIGHO2_01_FULL_40_24]|uniref:Uncharacterized protein n=1 Tax=Candidatus Daviesbacteria bacterium GW2011_GWC2_40_12 TaxID=1618431 RepID=A0A0G0T6T7_9BACT|nr:MAG: hypothetical protein UT45_C0001G0128 [Candidatus Daviesbacteria bacterium GW2011_GWA2_39_33]KKR42830.1 MAG: hypothetical protein UT77_C0001G0281 [Candidatus Daviesbacteria bacterium GW2011_GWC2_40_12]OGE21592.1 MAG: hypothetical protein A2778_05395 [Candidatus Daviesbacteria bacterium RIFCSPHIGHO2_01_FULL_40_24]OGE29988.1 MAG: hypothetical protein A3C29_01100 [Candidatus Daviesbacteria bacterium RIFCSPHIGHO2_02_FULL_40_16]OGE43577.1 MAG: hypothetical protein A3A53_03015 [Candidatus Davi